MSITVKEYPNGFRTVYEKSHSDLPITALYLFCDVGSVYEYDKMRGASHFIEHMCFKGTTKMPRSQDILDEYAKIGAYFNAYTTKRYTCFTVKCQDEYVQHCLNILSDMLTNSLFNETEYNKEEKVVIEENNNNDNDPENIKDMAIDRVIYAGSSYEFPVDCLDYHTRRTLEYKNVVEFYHFYYQAGNMFLSVVSNLTFRDIDSATRKSLFTKGRKSEQNVPRIINHRLTPQIGTEYRLIKKRGVSNVFIDIGFRVCGRNNQDRYALTLLEKIMGDGLSGRLMTVLRDRGGLVYGAKGYSEFYEYSGEFVISTKTRTENTRKVLVLLISILKDMIRKGVSKEELEIAKGNFQGNVLLDLQDIVTQARYNGEELLFTPSHISSEAARSQRQGFSGNSIVPYKDIFETFIAPLTVKDMNRTIQQYFINQNMCVSILSEKLPSLEIVQKSTVI